MKEKGYVLITTLMVVFIISLGMSSVFLIGMLESRSSNNNIANNLAFQSAENAIDKTLGGITTTRSELYRVLGIESDEDKRYCISNNGTLETTCVDIYLNEDKSIKSENKIYRRMGECFSFGNSDQQSGCFVIEGIGEIPSLNLKTINKQEIKINTINANSDGVYEY